MEAGLRDAGWRSRSPEFAHRGQQWMCLQKLWANGQPEMMWSLSSLPKLQRSQVADSTLFLERRLFLVWIRSWMSSQAKKRTLGGAWLRQRKLYAGSGLSVLVAGLQHGRGPWWRWWSRFSRTCPGVGRLRRRAQGYSCSIWRQMFCLTQRTVQDSMIQSHLPQRKCSPCIARQCCWRIIHA